MRCADTVLHIASVGLLAGLTSCATLAHGTKQNVPITSSPSGAPVMIDGVRVGVTPYTAELERRTRHRLVVGEDSASQVGYELTRRPSAWLLADLLFYPVILVDVLTGAAFAFTPGSRHIVLPNPATIVTSPTTVGERLTVQPVSQVAPAPDTTTYWGLARGHPMRLATPERRDTLVSASLDSVVVERLYWRPELSGYGAVSYARNRVDIAPSMEVPLTDVRRLQVQRPADYGKSGTSMIRHGTMLSWAVPLIIYADIGSQQRGFKRGAGASAIAIPVSFLYGAMMAERRWAPFEAHRAGSPLLVDDRVRIRQLGSTETLSGRLLDVEPKHLVVRVGPQTLRIARTDVLSLERADGFNLWSRAKYGAVAGAMLAFADMGTCNCRHTQAESYTIPVTGALMGLLFSPALAPRRWISVPSW